jgi:hypothetical protein
VDGGAGYDGIPFYSKCIFDDSHLPHMVAHGGGEFFRAEVQIAEK